MPGFVGIPELMLLGLVVLLVFGPKRLPEMGRSLGKGLREFKDSISGDSSAKDLDVEALVREHERSPEPASAKTNPVAAAGQATAAERNGAVTTAGPSTPS